MTHGLDTLAAANLLAFLVVAWLAWTLNKR